ncbi:hypothetical protein PG995_014699 [Apiospora arundinis]
MASSSSTTTDTNGRSMESRTGRSKQRYNSSGERLVAGVVPLTEDKNTSCLSSQHGGKAGCFPREAGSPMRSVPRPLPARPGKKLVSLSRSTTTWEISSRPDLPKKTHKESSKSVYRFYEATVLKEEEDWPERHKRERCWMSFPQAKEALATRPELLEALTRSTMQR